MEVETRDRAGLRLRLMRSSWVPRAQVEAALDTLLRLATGPRFSGERISPLGTTTVAKGGGVSGPGARRHSARRWFLGAFPPAEAEALNLDWLCERLFNAASPVLALTVWRRGVLRGQLLLTRPVAGVVELDRAWESAQDRPALAAELGTELGRMHALRFVHGDAYARNLLVADAPLANGPGIGRRVVFVDAWAGGPAGSRSRALRPLERDLGCLFLDAAGWMEAEHQLTLLRRYRDARIENGRPIKDSAAWLAAVGRARAREVRRLEARPGRLRANSPPPERWRIDPAALRGDRSH
ncbi:MAG: lipopolysaccharide kinase InaA family protein [Planctomycetota bacterium]|nr:lipopolysaccharide kinase InaA family protein [Planctomycetota bacterium]